MLFTLENAVMIELLEETVNAVKEQSDIVVQIRGNNGRTLSLKRNMYLAIMKENYLDVIALSVIKCVPAFMPSSVNSLQVFENDNVVAKLIS